MSMRLIVLSVLLASCTGTPMPAPPIEPPPSPDIERIVIEPPTPTSPGQLLGGSGAVAPGAQLFVLNLDGLDDSTLVEPSPDGSFVVATEPGTIRLEAIDADGIRSEPIDVNADGLVEVMLPCLQIASQLDASGELLIDNQCGDVVMAQLGLRRVGEYQVMEGEIELPAGESMMIEVSAAADTGADALFVFVESPLIERRAVTLF